MLIDGKNASITLGKESSKPVLRPKAEFAAWEVNSKGRIFYMRPKNKQNCDKRLSRYLLENWKRLRAPF
jgi:hypothetical protein